MTKRRVGAISAAQWEPNPGVQAANECDTNADTCCLGTNWVILEYTRRTADVYAYDKSIKPIEGVPIVSGATTWHDPRSGEAYIVIINEALYYGKKLDHSLLNPNQIRSYGIKVWDNPFDQDRGTMIDVGNEISIPLQVQGTKIYWHSSAPTKEELERCPRIVLTSKREWNPETVVLKEVQAMTQKRKGNIHLDSDMMLLHSVEPSLGDLKLQLQAVSKNVSYDMDLEDTPVRQTYTSTERHKKVSASLLAERFGIGLHRAQGTLKATLQRGMRSAVLPIGRRYRADRQFGVRRLNGKFATDTLWAKALSLRGNVAAQIYSHKCGFKALYPISKADNEQVGYSLSKFVSEYGAPDHLTYDGAAVQVGRKTLFQDLLRRHEIKNHVSAPRRPNENPAEAAIRELKFSWYRLQAKKAVPDRLWDFGMEYVCQTQCHTVNASRYSNGRTPMEIITGETPDISEYMDFGFYDWVWYRTNAGLGQPELGKWLGVSHRVGQLMSYWILPISGIPISCTTVQQLTNLERETEENRRRMNEFQQALERKWTTMSPNLSRFISDIPKGKLVSMEHEEEEFVSEYKRVIDSKLIPEADDEIGKPDPYLDMELAIQRGEGGPVKARVKKQAMDDEGIPIGKPNDNPLLDHRQYEVMYEDGHSEILTANIIAENLLSQVDDRGHRHLMIDEIEDHRVSKNAIPMSEGTYTTSRGLKKRKVTTRGWEVYVRWKDGSASWVKLKDIKDSYPVQLADYAEANDLSQEPVFAWWVPYALKKRKGRS